MGDKARQRESCPLEVDKYPGKVPENFVSGGVAKSSIEQSRALKVWDSLIMIYFESKKSKTNISPSANVGF